MPPTKKKADERIPFGTKLPPELINRLRRWAFTQDAEIQDVVELALEEFLGLRGAPRPSKSGKSVS